MIDDIKLFSDNVKAMHWNEIQFKYYYGITDKLQAQFPTEIEQLRSKLQSMSKPGTRAWKQWQFIFEDIFQPLNRIHFENGLPKELLGIGLGFKLYRALIEHLKYACSEANATDAAKRIWDKLFSDNTLICYKFSTGQYLAISQQSTITERKKIYDTWENSMRGQLNANNATLVSNQKIHNLSQYK